MILIIIFILVVQCTAEEVGNATYIPGIQLHNYNTTINYTCNKAFAHTAGDLTRTCQANATWTGATPACIGNTVCLQTTIIPNSKGNSKLSIKKAES